MRVNSSDVRQYGVDTILLESKSLNKLSTLLDESFSDVVEEILSTDGRVVVTGIGKSAIVGQKMVATFNSTGTPSLFMHAADAIHGDLGMVQNSDIVICISKSGNSPEIKALVPLILKGGNKLIGVVGNLCSFLAENSNFVLNTVVEEEACPNNLAPTTSTIAQMAMGDALAVALIKCRDFKSGDFAKYHPGGSLGKKLYLTLEDMAKNNQVPTVGLDTSLTDCIMSITKGRLGATVVINEGQISGVITDGDLRRMLSSVKKIESVKASDIMTKNPRTMDAGILAIKGVDFLKKYSINHIILTEGNELKGLVNIQDFVKEGLI